MSKTDKELAFLHDLYVASDWGERFAELIDEHVELPKKARALYVAAGAGGHALKLVERIGEGATLVGVDESEEQLKLARAKAAAAKLQAQAEFRQTQIESLDFEDEQFDLVIGDASMIAPERLPEMIAEMARVAAPGATVAVNLATASSYGEFFSIYWEALLSAGLEDEAPIVEELITKLPTVSDVEQLAARGARRLALLDERGGVQLQDGRRVCERAARARLPHARLARTARRRVGARGSPRRGRATHRRGTQRQRLHALDQSDARRRAESSLKRGRFHAPKVRSRRQPR